MGGNRNLVPEHSNLPIGICPNTTLKPTLTFVVFKLIKDAPERNIYILYKKRMMKNTKTFYRLIRDQGGIRKPIHYKEKI